MSMLLNLLPYVAVALNLVLILGLFFGLNCRISKLRRRMGNCDGKLDASSFRLSEEINELGRKITTLEQTEVTPIGGAASLGNGVNVTLRSKVLKMHRMGQPMDHIADTLRVPRGEVDLLLKVHRIVMRAYEDGTKVVPQDAVV